jgi:GDP-L-fucose synthase
MDIPMVTLIDEELSLTDRRVWVAGHRGMVGSAIVRNLARENCEILTALRSELDLTRQSDVEDWMAEARPEVVFVAAAKVGGILANDGFPADFLYDNLAIEMNVINASWRLGVRKLLFLGSSCVYPKLAPQPITEDVLMTGPLEPTNEWYAIAKIAGIRMCQAYRRQHGCDFISAMPTNLYGPNDNFDMTTSHVVPALLRRIHDAKLRRSVSIEVWGTGRPRREFLHVDDLAAAAIQLIKRYSAEMPVNVGTGVDISIAELATIIAKVVGYSGNFLFDRTKPDGTPRKLLDVRRIGALGWRPRIELFEGLRQTYQWFLENAAGGMPHVAANDELAGSARAHP